MDCDRYLDAMKGMLPSEYAPVLAGLPRWNASAPFTFASLTKFYRDFGAGLYARYRAFLWENGRLIPVSDPRLPQAPGHAGLRALSAARLRPIPASWFRAERPTTSFSSATAARESRPP